MNYKLKISKKTLNDRYRTCLEIINYLNKIDSFSKKSVLDFGSGEGFFIKKISPLFKNAIGYEPTLSKELKNGNLKLVNSFDKIQKNKYKLITSTAVFEHLHNPGFILSQLNKTLFNKGYFLIAIPNPGNLQNFGSLLLRPNLKKSLTQRSTRILKSYSKESHHIHFWDHNHIVNLFASCGFKLLDFYPAEKCPLPFFKLKKFFPFLPDYINLPKPLNRLSYSNVFLFQKVENCNISIYD